MVSNEKKITVKIILCIILFFSIKAEAQLKTNGNTYDEKQHYNHLHKSNIEESDKPTTFQKIRTLITFNLYADFSTSGNNLVYEGDILPSTKINYLDYYFTFEVYTPVIRWQRSFLPLQKTIKRNYVSINSDSYMNYSYSKFDLLGFVNLRRFISLKWDKNVKFLDYVALFGPFYKKTVINTSNYSLNKEIYSTFIGALTYGTITETIYNSSYIFNNEEITDGHYTINSTTFGLQIDEFYSTYLSYLIHKAKFETKSRKHLSVVPTPAVSLYKINSEFSYYNNTDILAIEEYNGIGFTAGIGAIFLYNHFGDRYKLNYGIYSKVSYTPWHNESLHSYGAQNEVYRDFENEISFNIGLIFLNF